MSKRSGGGDKRSQWWSSIQSEKLDALRWTLLHSGLNVATLQNDDGQTGLQIAALGNKHKALLVILDTMRSQRTLVDAVDVPDEDGRTPLMLAASKGHLQACDHFIYYGASLKAKDRSGKTALDHAKASKNQELIETLEEEMGLRPRAPEPDDATEDIADGMTTTQRNKAKKRALMEAERKGLEAAVKAAAAAGDGGEAAAEGEGAPTVAGLPPLPSTAPAPVWPEIKTVMDEKRRELTVTRSAKAAGAGAEETAAAEVTEIDAALWHCNLLNRVELHLGPSFVVLSPQIGRLTALQTLILSGNGLTSLPDTLGMLTDLKFLDISRNQLAALPADIAKLTKLEVLDAADNQLTSIEALAPMTTLTTLTLDRNQLTDLAPLNYGGLPRLEHLSAQSNKLASIPDEIGQLGQGNSLAYLNVAENEITELPAGLAELKEKKIKELKLLPNPIADKKVLKILNADRPEKVVKELFKYLEANAGAGKGKKGGKKK